jgi:phosphohistidine phosphatase
MRTLLLMRHAKSDWGDAGTSDVDRPLAQRGVKAAPRMARWMDDQGLRPGAVLCSPARRADETAQLVCAALGLDPPDIRPPLYLPSIDEVLGELATATASCLLLVSHNPMCEVFIEKLTGQVHTVRTAAVAVLEFDIDDWSDLLLDQQGRLVCVQAPKEL